MSNNSVVTRLSAKTINQSQNRVKSLATNETIDYYAHLSC